MTTVAIMQPTYLPWSGYFGLIESVDIFVILDTVQFAKRSWQQRNQIKTPKGSAWLSIPVFSKGKKDQTIQNTLINKNDNFSYKHKKTIEINYKRSSFFENEYKEIFELINSNEIYLAELNIKLIKYFCKRLKIKTKIIRAKDLNVCGIKAELLCSICQELNANKYFSPPGSKDYIDESDVFQEANISVYYYIYNHPIYKQLWGEFIPYMSIIDLIFNCGDDSINLVKENFIIQ